MRSKIYLTTLTMAIIFTICLPWNATGQAASTPQANRLLADIPQPVPHPILSDLRVRQAIAYCTNKDALLAAAYPELTLEERQALIMDTFILESSWAYSEPSIIYDYDPAQGKVLLEEAGWVEPSPGAYRLKDGNELYLQLNTTDASLRLAFLPVFEAQMQACGIHLLRTHAPSTWLFGSLTGLQVRDFELTEFAWGLSEDPGGEESLFACDQIPAPENGWTGQNFMGWCNPEASEAIKLAGDTSLPLEERAAYYAIVIDLLAEDIPSLPLFLRADATFYEHIDFNLQTYAQDAELPPEGTGQEGLTFTDYSGLLDTVAAPAGAVSEATVLRYYPLVANAQPTPDGLLMAKAFRFNAVLGGVPQDGFIFDQPLILTIQYDLDPLALHYLESSLLLYVWDTENGLWMDASETCPLADRYQSLDTDNNLYQVNICHFSEFGLFVRGGDSIRMGVDYWRNAASGVYEVGHTFYVRVSNSQGVVKATAIAETEPGGEIDTGSDYVFAWQDGFCVLPWEWSVPNVDILPGDRVYFESDDGFTETIDVGTIDAVLNPATDTAWGTITAPVMPLTGEVGWWSTFEVFTIAPDGSFFVHNTFWDMKPGENGAVMYYEQDRDVVWSQFTVPIYSVTLPLVMRY